MACLNCTTRVLRIFLHTSPPPLRPTPRLLPLLRPQQKISYARLSTHLSASRNQSTLATLSGELTDDDYVPFDYHVSGAVPAAIGADVRSGWPPPVPEAGRIECEPDIELTSPHEEMALWDGVQEPAEEKRALFLKREGYWTLDGSEKTYSLVPKKNKGRRKREREERERMAAAQALLEENKDIDAAVLTPTNEETVDIAAQSLSPIEEEKIDASPSLKPLEEVKADAAVVLESPVEEKTIDATESADIEQEHHEVNNSTNNIEADSSDQDQETLSQRTLRKAARKAWEEKKTVRLAWEEKKVELDAKFAHELGVDVQTLKESRKAFRNLEKKQLRRERRAAQRETAGIPDESTEGHRYDQFFSDSPGITSTKPAPRDPRESPNSRGSPKHRKNSTAIETPKVPEKLTLRQEKRLGLVPDLVDSYNFSESRQPTETWGLQIPEVKVEPTRLQRYVAVTHKKKLEPWMAYKARLQEKFKGQAWAPPKKLSPDAQEAIRVLRRNHPEITIPMLANKFEVSGEAIRRILKSRWRDQVKTPEIAQEWAEKWARRGQKVWQRWEEAGVVHSKKKRKNEWKLQKVDTVRGKAGSEKVPTVDTSGLSDRLL